MVVTVKLHAGLRRLVSQPLERGEARLELADGATLQAVLRALGLPDEQVLVALINGRSERDLATPLQPGDRVALVPPVAGGGEATPARASQGAAQSLPGRQGSPGPWIRNPGLAS